MDDVSSAPHVVRANVRSPSDRRTALVSGAPLNVPRSSGGAGGSAASHYTCHNGFPRLHGENAAANRNEHPSQTIATWSYLWIDTHTSDGARNWLPLGMVPRRPTIGGVLATHLEDAYQRDMIFRDPVRRFDEFWVRRLFL